MQRYNNYKNIEKNIKLNLFKNDSKQVINVLINI